MTHSPYLQLLWIALAGAPVFFAVVWLISVRIRNYGLLDAIWSLSLAVLAPMYALFGSGLPARRALFAAVGTAWSLRLGMYILIRVLRHHPAEDPRYRTLRERWPGPGMFLLFFELQALIAVVFSLPFFFASMNATAQIDVLEIAGLALAVAGIAGESVADLQSQCFKRRERDRKAVLDTGLWRYSRHPNYFFESLTWWGFAIAALVQPYGWIALVCPLLMLYFLLCVTGIPLTEKHSLASRGDAYRAYQLRTSRFIPWPPKAGT